MNQTEYLLVGSVPDLVQSFIQSNQLTPVAALDETTFIVQADAKGLCQRMNMVANMYTKQEVQAKDRIAGIFDEDIFSTVKKWANTPSI